MSRLITAVNRVQPQGPVYVDVPEDVAAELAELAQHLVANPSQVAHAKFDTADEVTEFIAQARYWATENDLVFRKLAAKRLPENEIRFSLKTAAQDEADSK